MVAEVTSEFRAAVAPVDGGVVGNAQRRNENLVPRPLTGPKENCNGNPKQYPAELEPIGAVRRWSSRRRLHFFLFWSRQTSPLYEMPQGGTGGVKGTFYYARNSQGVGPKRRWHASDGLVAKAGLRAVRPAPNWVSRPARAAVPKYLSREGAVRASEQASQPAGRRQQDPWRLCRPRPRRILCTCRRGSPLWLTR